MTDSDEGKAILGSPNGRGAGLLLATHKSTFGAKFIDSVVFWCEDDYINLLFNVGKIRRLMVLRGTIRLKRAGSRQLHESMWT